MKFLSFSCACLIAATASVAGAHRCLGMKGNNLDRCFAATPVLANAYCSSYLSIPTATTTLTILPVTTISVPDVVATEVDVFTSEFTSTSLSTSTVIVLETAYITTTIAGLISLRVTPKKLRDVHQNGAHEARKAKVKPSPTGLVCVIGKKATSISSACQCLALATSTVTVSQTAGASTQTNHYPVTTTTSTTTILEVVTLAVQTELVTSVETDVVTVASVSSLLSSSSTAPVSSSVSAIDSSTLVIPKSTSTVQISSTSSSSVAASTSSSSTSSSSIIAFSSSSSTSSSSLAASSSATPPKPGVLHLVVSTSSQTCGVPTRRDLARRVPSLGITVTQNACLVKPTGILSGAISTYTPGDSAAVCTAEGAAESCVLKSWWNSDCTSIRDQVALSNVGYCLNIATAESLSVECVCVD